MTLLHRILFGGRETGLTFCYVQSMNLWKKKVVHMVVIMLRNGCPHEVHMQQD